MQFRSTHKKGENRRGFTLIEAMVSLAIFTIVVAGIFEWLNQGIVTAQKTRDLNRVTQIMQYQIENLRSYKWTVLGVEMGNRIIPVDKNGIPMESSIEPPYDWQAFELRQFIVPQSGDLYRCKLTATWTDRRGKDYTQTFETWFTENGLNAYYTRSI